MKFWGFGPREMRSERKPWATLIVVALFGLTGKAGTITGLVRAQAKEGTDEASAGKFENRKYKFSERVNYGELRDFVVYVDQRATEKLSATPSVSGDSTISKKEGPD